MAGGESSAQTDDGSSEYFDDDDDDDGGGGDDSDDEATQRAWNGQADGFPGDGGDSCGERPRRTWLAPKGAGPHETEQVLARLRGRSTYFSCCGTPYLFCMYAASGSGRSTPSILSTINYQQTSYHKLLVTGAQSKRTGVALISFFVYRVPRGYDMLETLPPQFQALAF